MVIGLKVCFTDTEGTADIADIADTAAATENISIDSPPLRQAPSADTKKSAHISGRTFCSGLQPQGLLTPVTGLVITTLKRTELQACILVEVVDLIVDEVDHFLTVLDRVEVHLVGCAALHNRDLDLRLGHDSSGLQQELGLVVGEGYVTQILDILTRELAG